MYIFLPLRSSLAFPHLFPPLERDNHKEATDETRERLRLDPHKLSPPRHARVAVVVEAVFGEALALAVAGELEGVGWRWVSEVGKAGR